VVRVIQWAQERGEVGGVLSAHSMLSDSLSAEGHDVRYVDTGSPRRAIAAMPGLWRRGLHIFHITRLWRALVMAPVFAVLPGRTVVVLHSGSSHLQLRQFPGPVADLVRLSLRAYDEIWVVSGQIRDGLPPALQRRTTVVRFPVTTSDARPAAGVQQDPHAISIATNAGLPHYNAELAVDAVQRVREEWPDARLSILAYGNDGAHMAQLRAKIAGLDWIELSFDADVNRVAATLARSGVFLRPTSWDGDSLIVREALAAGARVVASDVCPRAEGVELAALDAPAFAEAILRGGPVSDGAGLAEASALDAAHGALDALAGPGRTGR
jgi:glycosyltransferase involved in cell wall biosynthesis